MPTVVLENLTKAYGGTVVVNDVNLRVNDGETMVIVGPSGCGKTTTLRMIAGLETVTHGTVSIDGKVMNSVPAHERGLAMVFQNYALYPHLTVFDNMALALRLRKFSADDVCKRVHEASELLGLEQVLNRKPQSLSGGQRQRVALGRAIAVHPKVLLMDEPLSNLDAQLRASMRVELKALHHRLRTTAVYVTHDQTEAMMLGDRICVMYGGQVQQVETPMEVYSKPANRFVAGFIGSPPMNFFTGCIDVASCRFQMETEHIRLPASSKTSLARLGEQGVVLGIRPADLSLEPASGDGHGNVKGTVIAVEPLGDRSDICMQTAAGTRFVVSSPTYLDVRAEEIVTAVFRPDRMHLFESGGSGRRVETGT